MYLQPSLLYILVASYMPEWPATNIQIHRQCCRSWPLCALIFVRPEPEMNTCIAFLLGPYIFFFCHTRVVRGSHGRKESPLHTYTLARLEHPMVHWNECIRMCIYIYMCWLESVLASLGFSKSPARRHKRQASNGPKTGPEKEKKKICEHQTRAATNSNPKSQQQHLNAIGKKTSVIPNYSVERNVIVERNAQLHCWGYAYLIETFGLAYSVFLLFVFIGAVVCRNQGFCNGLERHPEWKSQDDTMSPVCLYR